MVVAEKKEVKKVPEGYSAVTPWIVSPDSARLISFLTKAFGAEEIEGRRMISREGIITHAEIMIDDAVILLLDAGRSWPQTPAFIRLFVDDAEKSYQKALKAGARAVAKPNIVADPFGNIWCLQENGEEEVSSISNNRNSLNSELAKRSHPSTL